MSTKTTKWYVGGYRLLDKPTTPGFGNASWFATNLMFPTKKEAVSYIKERQKAMNKHGQVGYFTLRSETVVSYYQGEPLYSKVKLNG